MEELNLNSFPNLENCIDDHIGHKHVSLLDYLECRPHTFIFPCIGLLQVPCVDLTGSDHKAEYEPCVQSRGGQFLTCLRDKEQKTRGLGPVEITISVIQRLASERLSSIEITGWQLKQTYRLWSRIIESYFLHPLRN
jgi:hypothetical protein